MKPFARESARRARIGFQQGDRCAVPGMGERGDATDWPSAHYCNVKSSKIV